MFDLLMAIKMVVKLVVRRVIKMATKRVIIIGWINSIDTPTKQVTVISTKAIMRRFFAIKQVIQSRD